MSYLSTALQSALEAARITQTELALRSGLTTSQVNKAARSTSPVGPTVVGRLIKALPSPHNAEVLAAYLRDAVPSGFTELVAILPSGSKIQERPDPIPTDLQGPDRDLIGYFAQRVHHAEIRRMLEAVRDAMEAD